MEKLLLRYPALGACRGEILAALDAMKDAFGAGGKLLLCGNGGSAADCEHIVGELMKSFLKKRPLPAETKKKLSAFGKEGEALAEKLEAGLPAIALSGHPSLSTAFANDKDPEMIFAEQVAGYGKRGDVLLALSTSGNSKNCVLAAIAAKAQDMKVISITGEGGGRLSELADVAIRLPERETYLVQELTLPVYHYLCAALEEHFFGE